MNGDPPVALVEDDADLRTATAQLLALAGFAVHPFADGATAAAAIDAGFAGPVVSDVRMPGVSGIELFRLLRARDAELPVILVTGHGDVAMAVDALKAGAWDFLSKPFDGEALVAAVRRAATARALALENRRLRAVAGQEATWVGESAEIARLRAMIPLLADAALDLVIEGETGTGKELFARLVHRAGARGRHRFQPIDCAALPAELAGPALVGRHGPIARAHRGTLFLDHLDRAPAELQHRLALFAERRVVAPDEREPDAVDVRIVAAIGEGGRERILPELYHRLAGVPLRVPPLSERRGDIPLLFAGFVEAAAQRHRRAVPALAEAAHRAARGDWPGNVRELELAAERLVLGLEPAAAGTPGETLPQRVEAFERAAIREAIAAAGGEVARAVALLGIPRETFYYRVKRLGIDLKAERRNAAG
ncbi:sigma-54-dependent transcriptional regulator [Sphingomonas corticis]|jgi:two-component system C4-dicarboxylate transport response regulator DctD|uniref:Sigma-54-dependent Fis family transcriptional regulator n=1 Tax=Sphingomonas corticis TaxID=2722791 RepID=A0ABX1CRI8_9SPHN|nr:sigma-54 dependent transcriptional regulator [Sphingomonas corticis]NJR80541.1 sigma-54-dependent Fis family transcriptional regulator [Sphingomonas corticis]